MIRLRKRNGSWEIRWRRCYGDTRSFEWKGGYSLEYVQQHILGEAYKLDSVISEALKVIDGTHEYLTFRDGRLHNSISWSETGRGCMTMYNFYLYNIENTIKHIQSGEWKVRMWHTPSILAGKRVYLYSDETAKGQYLIAETKDDSVVPSEVII